MAKKITVGTCPYCFAEDVALETKEHVIPSSWFIHDAYPYKKSIKIDTCKPCNNSKAKEDEWMRNWLTTIAFDKSKAAEAVMMSKIKRSVESGKFRPQFQAQYDKMTLVDVLPDGTKVEDGMTMIHVADDWDRVIGYVDQMVRGLFCHKYGSPLPKTHGIQTRYANDHLLRLDQNILPMLQMFGTSDWEKANDPVFFYGITKSTDSDHWVCFMAFYDTLAFLSVIAPHDWIKEREHIFSPKQKV